MSRKMVLKKYGSIFIVCILLVGLLSGCGMREKDAKAYVTATLDASYKGKFKEYKKQTDATEKEVKNLYQENIDTMMQSSGLDSIGASEKMTEMYDLMADKLKNPEYGKAEVRKVQIEKDDDGVYSIREKDLTSLDAAMFPM